MDYVSNEQMWPVGNILGLDLSEVNAQGCFQIFYPSCFDLKISISIYYLPWASDSLFSHHFLFPCLEYFP